MRSDQGKNVTRARAVTRERERERESERGEGEEGEEGNRHGKVKIAA